MIGTTLYFFQEKLLFLPTVLEQDYQFQFKSEFEEVFLKTEGGASINAIHFKCNNSKGIVLYFHGNAGDLQRWGTYAEWFVTQDYDVFIMDYRTYGKSVGKLSEQALYDDAQLCYDYVLNQYKPKDIIIYGRSLGTGIAAHLASKNMAQQLILETPYYSITDVAKFRFPMFPVERLLKYKIPTHQYIENVNYPITIFHGTNDSVVPYESGKKIEENSNKSIHFITIKEGNHGDLATFELYVKELSKLLE